MVVSKTRLIYTAGTFAIPAELSVCRRVVTAVSVLRRPPTQEYQNERSNPPKGFLGYVGLFINSYCERILPLEFDPQAILLWDNPAIQLYYSTLCTGATVIDALVALGAAMTPPAILLPVTPSASPFQGCPYTTLKFKLLFGTRIQVDTIGEEVVACAGIVPEATVPDFGPPPDKYPSDRARSEDPARSSPEDGELPGDTAPATADDPDISLTIPPCILTVGLTRSDLGTEDRYSIEVPDATYNSPFINTIGPGTTYIVQVTGSGGTLNVAGPFNPGSVVITITYVNNSCS